MEKKDENELEHLTVKQFLSKVLLVAVPKTQVKDDVLQITIGDWGFTLATVIEVEYAKEGLGKGLFVTKSGLKKFGVSESEVLLSALKHTGDASECIVDLLAGPCLIDATNYECIKNLLNAFADINKGVMVVGTDNGLIPLIRFSVLFNSLANNFPDSSVLFLAANQCLVIRDKDAVDNLVESQSKLDKGDIIPINLLLMMLSHLEESYTAELH